MIRFKKKEEDYFKKGRNYLIAGFNLTFFGTIFVILTFSFINSLPQRFANAIVLLYEVIITVYFFGIYYFFLGIKKSMSIIEKISYKFLVYFGITSFVLFFPLFLYGYISPIECYSYGCKWRVSLLELVMLIIGIFLVIISAISIFFTLNIIKDESIVKSEEIPRNPVTKVLYKIRREENNMICGNCHEINNFEILNEEKGIYRCLNCNSENYL